MAQRRCFIQLRNIANSLTDGRWICAIKVRFRDVHLCPPKAASERSLRVAVSPASSRLARRLQVGWVVPRLSHDKRDC